jgi:cytochrome c oxidase cbb3-type subunit 3
MDHACYNLALMIRTNQVMTRTVIVSVVCAVIAAPVTAQPPDRRAESPASSAIPPTVVEQDYSPELVAAGRDRFGTQCGFCHGLDTAGASGGPDLTRSDLVARDVRGDLIVPVVRNGRLEAGLPMPAFPGLPDADLDAMVAYIHDQKIRFESAEGGRRSVSVDDLQTGDARAGQAFFDQNCTACHDVNGDLDGVGSRLQGLGLLQRMLYPRNRGPATPEASPSARVTLPNGEAIEGLIAFEDEFTLALTDASGRYRSFAKSRVEYTVDNPLDEHIELLGRYTDDDMHNVFAFLQRLR